MLEDERTEFKKEVAGGIAKAAVAFSNTEGGQILVGIDDDGKIIGVNDTDDTMKTCAQILRDSVRPDITATSSLRIVESEGKNIVKIDIQEGSKKPYYLREKGMRSEGVYLRKGTTNMPVSEEVFALMMQNIRSRSYETMTSLEQDLSFRDIAREFSEKGLPFDDNHMRILGMIGKDGYTNLGWLLSDQFDIEIKVAFYKDEYKSQFLNRREFSGSVVSQFRDVLKFITGQTNRSSTISGIYRSDTEEYPPEAIREVLLNAIIHRDYAISGTILISVYDNKMTFSSPGSINEAYTLEDLKLGVSSTRNPKLANVFYRLGLVETYGSGIPRIMYSYNGYNPPEIIISNSVFFVSLPSTNCGLIATIEELFRRKTEITRSDLEKSGYSRAESLDMLNMLLNTGKIRKIGGGRSTKYIVNSKVIKETQTRVDCKR